MMKYAPPEWAEAPPEGQSWWLEQVREGCEGGVHSVGQERAWMLLGRERSSVDVAIEHPSVSRVHAALEFFKQRVFLRDLGSTQGTFVNPSHKSQHSPFTELCVGDCFRLASSNRLLFLHGPDELRPPEFPRGAQPLPTQSQHHQKQSSFETDIHGDECNDDARVSHRTFAGSLSAKEQQLKAKLEKKERQKHKLEQEFSKIEAKNNKWEGGLSEKQQSRLDSCAQQLQALEHAIEDSEEELNDSINARLDISKRTSGKRKRNEDLEKTAAGALEDDDDEYLDRSKHGRDRNRRAETSRTDQNQQSLKLSDLVQRVEAADAELSAAREALSQVEQAHAPDDQLEQRNADDELDGYMQSLSNNLVQDKLQKAQERLRRAEEEQKQAHHMLDVADPAKLYRHHVDKLQESQQQKRTHAEQKKASEEQRSEREAVQHGEWKHSSEDPQEPTEEEQQTLNAADDGGTRLLTREQLHEAVMQTGSVETVVKTNRAKAGKSMEERDKERLGFEVHGGGLESRIRRRSEQQDEEPDAATAKAQEDVACVLAATQRGVLADEEQDVQQEEEKRMAEEWKPPEGQKGDGRTKLNDLLGY
jgi:pSer/pThr/pTyr-binding forkhead associated (FHA) protein